jgi:hypothetical protein
MSDDLKTQLLPMVQALRESLRESCERVWETYDRRIAELEAENVGLREALAEILEDAHEEAYPHIRAALKEIDNG